MTEDLEVNVEEVIEAGESIGKWKPWFNGHHFFYTVKVLPVHL